MRCFNWRFSKINKTKPSHVSNTKLIVNLFYIVHVLLPHGQHFSSGNMTSLEDYATCFRYAVIQWYKMANGFRFLKFHWQKNRKIRSLNWTKCSLAVSRKNENCEICEWKTSSFNIAWERWLVIQLWCDKRLINYTMIFIVFS